ncbi:MAG: HK97 family phage prohead protease [Planctomycetota bacterium]
MTTTPTMPLILDPSCRDAEPEVGQLGTTRMFTGPVASKGINTDARTIDFTCSTGTIDRYGEIVEPEAFRRSLPQFMQNPAFPFGHSYDASSGHLPTVGYWKNVRITDNSLVGTAYFKPRGLGEECWQDYNDGTLRSVSVAFLTRAWEMREMRVDGVTQRVRVFTDVDLIEISAVLIPANPEARLRAAGFGLTYGLTPQLTQTLDRFERLLKAASNGVDDGSDTTGPDDPEHPDGQDAAEGFGRGLGDAGHFGDAYLASTPPAPPTTAERSADGQGDLNATLAVELADLARQVSGSA